MKTARIRIRTLEYSQQLSSIVASLITVTSKEMSVFFSLKLLKGFYFSHA